MLESQRRVFPETKDDITAIRGGLIEGKSGRKSGGGMGYITIKEALGQLSGSLDIRSGQGVVLYNSTWEQPRVYRKSTSYPGTQLFFRWLYVAMHLVNTSPISREIALRRGRFFGTKNNFCLLACSTSRVERWSSSVTA